MSDKLFHSQEPDVIDHIIMATAGKISFDKPPCSERYYAKVVYTRKTFRSSYPQENNCDQHLDYSEFKHSVFVPVILVSSDASMFEEHFKISYQTDIGIFQNVESVALEYLHDLDSQYGVSYKVAPFLIKKMQQTQIN